MCPDTIIRRILYVQSSANVLIGIYSVPGMSIMIVIVIALVIGLFVLTIGLLFLKK